MRGERRLKRFLSPRWFYFLRRDLKPISDIYGNDRGTPICRYYIDNFLEKNKKLISGDCLEIMESRYTRKYGHDLNKTDILDIDLKNSRANIKGDLRKLDNIPDDTYDCIILTQTLQYIDDVALAVKECHRILKPGGKILVTVPAVGRIDPTSGFDGDFWRFTAASMKHLFVPLFKKTEINYHGNVLLTMGYLAGMSKEDFSKKELEYSDKNFPLLITALAIK
jgi:ubiquinone/menaquinone biosynthesis C-methylase UbiE